MLNPFSMASWGERELRKLARWVEREPLERDRARRLLSLGLGPLVLAAEPYFEDRPSNIREALHRVERLIQPGRADDMVMKLVGPGLRYGTARRRTERLCANVLAYFFYLSRRAEPGLADPHGALFSELSPGKPSYRRRVLDTMYAFFEDFLGYDTVVATLPPQPELPALYPEGLIDGH